MTISFNTYHPSDKEKIIEIFTSNCPKYFDSNDQSILIDFLDNYADNNFKTVVYEQNIIGCGGHYVKHKEKLIGIAWVMFKQYSLGYKHFLTISKDFFNYILGNIKRERLNYDIVVNTTQLLENTFNKFGFQTEKIIKDGFGENLDHYVMRRKWNS